MSTRKSPISRSKLDGTERPFTRAVERPPDRISRASHNRSGSSSFSSSFASSSARSSGAAGRSNTPSTSARSHPARTASLSALLPSSRPTASMMIDLPAPVSPVSTLKPAVSCRRRRSMMAKSMMVSSESIALFHEAQARRHNANADDQIHAHPDQRKHDRAEHAKTQGVDHLRHRRQAEASCDDHAGDDDDPDVAS